MRHLSLDRASGCRRGDPERCARIVLTAEGPGASLLLFIDDGRLSYLELAPHVDDVVADFPPIEALTV
ncbi:hypothetical protein [Microbacterium aurantiacum]|uniref:Uncharacterized protein n=1 Tax=Microbacterium aurantiacum TaxID=162393 RepID=A0ABT8FP64_9MICO|nr:hypothetical protein [Microbacterium aurantiacum]MDN4462990.1 hypothetical protein [Microbacterium aurantiacum]